MKTEKKISATAILQLIVSAVFLIGTRTFLSPCGPKEDGTFMSCHYAGLALTGLAVGLLVLSVISLFLKSRVAVTILGLLQIALAVIALVVPGTVIGLCMMPDMRCRAVMRPGSIVFAALIMVVSIIRLVRNRAAARTA